MKYKEENLRKKVCLALMAAALVFLFIPLTASNVWAKEVFRSAHDPAYQASENTQVDYIQITHSSMSFTESYTLQGGASQGNYAKPDYAKVHMTFKNTTDEAIDLRLQATGTDAFGYWAIPGSMANTYSSFTNVTTTDYLIPVKTQSSDGTYQSGTRTVALYPGESYTLPLQYTELNKSKSMNVSVRCEVIPKIIPVSNSSGDNAKIIQGADSIEYAPLLEPDSDSRYVFGGFWGTNWYHGLNSFNFNKQYYKFEVSKRSVYRLALLRIGGSPGNILDLYDSDGNLLHPAKDFELSQDVFTNNWTGNMHEVTLDPGTYYISVTNEKGYNQGSRAGTPRTFAVQMTRRDYVPATGIEYTKVKALPTSMKQGASASYEYKVSLLPENTDDRLYDAANGTYDQTITLKGTYKASTAGAKRPAINQKAYRQDMYISKDANERQKYVQTSLNKTITVKVLPKAPKTDAAIVTSYYNKVKFQSFNSNPGKLRVQQYKSGKWVLVKTVNKGKTGTVTGLKAGKKYKFRFQADVDGAVGDSSSSITVPTGISTKPSIKSIKVKSVSTSKTWFSGHWDTTYTHWTPGKYVYYTHVKYSITLKSKLKETTGIFVGSSYVKGTGKTFTVKMTYIGKKKGSKVKVTVRPASSKAYKGYGKSTTSKTVKIK